MPRVVPSLVVDAIGKVYPWAKEIAAGRGGYTGSLGPDQAPQISMLLALIDRLPEDLLPADASDYTLFEAAKGALRGALVSWSGAPHPGQAAQLAPQPLFGGHSPIVALLRILERSPDESSGSKSDSLSFIKDANIRADLEIDMSTAFRAFGNGEYKPATVIAGAVLEAVLLHAITQIEPQTLENLRDKVNAQRQKNGRRKLDERGLESWGLAEYIELSLTAGVIDSATAQAADLCRDFRNLIHPGRVLRTGERCTQATALIALGAMRRVADSILVKLGTPSSS